MTTLFRGDNNYKGGAVRKTLRCEANINTPWEHVRKESNQTSIFTSFSTSKKVAETFSKTNIMKVSYEELSQLEAQGKIELYTVDDVTKMMKSDPKKKNRIDANNVRRIMAKNNEILIKGQIPALYLKSTN